MIGGRYGLSWWLRWYRIFLQCRDPGLILGWRKSPGEGKGYTLQCFDLENFMEEKGITEDEMVG